MQSASSTHKRKTQFDVTNFVEEDKNKSKKQKTETDSKVEGSILSFFSKEQKAPSKSSLGVIVHLSSSSSLFCCSWTWLSDFSDN
jgi:hypothetical protein